MSMRAKPAPGKGFIDFDHFPSGPVFLPCFLFPSPPLWATTIWADRRTREEFALNHFHCAPLKTNNLQKDVAKIVGFSRDGYCANGAHRNESGFPPHQKRDAGHPGFEGIVGKLLPAKRLEPAADIHLGMGLAAVVTRALLVGGFLVPLEHGQFCVAALDHNPAHGMLALFAADFTSIACLDHSRPHSVPVCSYSFCRSLVPATPASANRAEARAGTTWCGFSPRPAAAPRTCRALR